MGSLCSRKKRCCACVPVGPPPMAAPITPLLPAFPMFDPCPIPMYPPCNPCPYYSYGNFY